MSKIITKPVEFDESLIKKKVEFTVPGKPFGKQRPRVVRRGRFTSTYTPKETVEYENKVIRSYKQQSKGTVLSGPIKAEILGIFEIPKSATKKEASSIIYGETPYTKKPDSDNIGKSILDALNGIAYHDDSAVCDLRVQKTYGNSPKVNVRLEEINSLSPLVFTHIKFSEKE
jgi:Holliday junction resolvase RusA-like endonuclease